jgi:hypothetical protein
MHSDVHLKKRLTTMPITTKSATRSKRASKKTLRQAQFDLHGAIDKLSKTASKIQEQQVQLYLAINALRLWANK